MTNDGNARKTRSVTRSHRSLPVEIISKTEEDSDSSPSQSEISAVLSLNPTVKVEENDVNHIAQLSTPENNKGMEWY